MTKLRVLHLAKFYPPERGGMERVLQLLCESTAGAVESRVLAAHTSRRTVRETVGRVSVTRAGRWVQAGSVAICPSFPYWLSRSDADLHVVHEPNALALVSDALLASRRPLIVWFHADLVRPSWKYHGLYKPFLNRVLARAAAVVVSSPRLAQEAIGLEGVRHKCVVIPFGVDADRFDRPAPAPEWIVELKRFRSGTVFLGVGRCVSYKGFDVLLRALVSVPDASFVLVGDGPERSRLEALSTDLGLNDRVRFVGAVSDEALRGAYQASDVFVLPSVSRQETFGVVQLEAMASGKPVISTDLPTGVPWVNQHGVSGLVVPAGDVAGLAAALRRLGADRQLRERLAAGARARVREEFTVEQVRDRLVALYQSVATNAGMPVRLSAGRVAAR